MERPACFPSMEENELVKVKSNSEKDQNNRVLQNSTVII